MNNIDSFNKGVALILATLYDSFPVPTILDVTKLNENVSAKDAEIYAASLSFLREEGFVRSGNSVGGGFVTSKVVLTSKGLIILNSTPEVLHERAPVLAERIKEVARGGSREALSAAVQSVVGAIVGRIL